MDDAAPDDRFERFHIRVPVGWSVARERLEHWDRIELEGPGARVSASAVPSGALSPLNAVAVWEQRVLRGARSLERWDVERLVAGVRCVGHGHSLVTGWLRRRRLVVEGFAGRLHRVGVLTLETLRERATPAAELECVLENLEVRETPDEVAARAGAASPTLDELFAHEDDGRLCDAVHERLVDLDPEADPRRCGEAERVVRLVWGSAAPLSNGGFAALFRAQVHGDLDFARTVAAYDAIGATQAAGVLREALERFLGTPPPVELAVRRERVDAVPDPEQWRLASEYYAARPEVDACLARFVRARRPELKAALRACEAKD